MWIGGIKIYFLKSLETSLNISITGIMDTAKIKTINHCVIDSDTNPRIDAMGVDIRRMVIIILLTNVSKKTRL